MKKAAVIIITVVLALLSCQKNKPARVSNATGRLKIMNVYYNDTAGVPRIRSFEFMYDNNDFLYQVKDPNSSTIYYNLSIDVDSNLLITSTFPEFDSYRVYSHQKKIDSILVDRPPIYNQEFYGFSTDSLLGETASAEGYFLKDFIKNDTGYIQSTIVYTSVGSPDLHEATNNYTYTTYLNTADIPMQFPYDGNSYDEGFSRAATAAGIPSALFLAGMNGYYGFSRNKYLINTVNGLPYQYTFNSNQQVIELRNNILDISSGWLTFEYY